MRGRFRGLGSTAKPMCWRAATTTTGATIHSPCILLDALAVPPTPGTVDNNAGPVVLNTWANWKCILEFALPDPLHRPKPQCKGARRPKEPA